MANIIKSSSGLLFLEEKWDDLSLLWDLSPNNPSRVAFTGDSISLLPGTDRTELLIPVPKEKGYVFQSQIDYHPINSSQSAGSMLRSVTNTYIDFEIRGDDKELCNFTKLIINDDYVLNAKASNDGTLWVDYGNTRFVDMNSIGYYIESGLDSDPAFSIKNCCMYKNNLVTINNFDRVNLIKFFDVSGNEITDKFMIKKKNSQIMIDGTNVVFPIDYLRIQVVDRITGEIYHEGELTNIYGGDVYEYNYNIEFFIDENKLTNSIYDLGTISNEKIFTLKISNKESFPIKGKKLKVNFYSVYNPGYRMADIAPDGGSFVTELDVEFLPGETKIFKLRTSRGKDFFYNIEDEYKFNIILE